MRDRDAVVIFRISDGKPSGVVRYVEVLKKCILLFSEYDILIVTFDIKGKYHWCYVNDNRIRELHFPFLGLSNPLGLDKSKLELHHEYLAVLMMPYLKLYRRAVFHVQEMCLMELAVHLRNKLNCRIIFHQHVIPWKFIYQSDETRFNKIYVEYIDGDYSHILDNYIEDYSYREADVVIAVTKMAKHYISEVFGVADSKIKVIYNGLFDSLAPMQTLNVLDAAPSLLFVGRISKEKGIFDLLDALLSVSLIKDCKLMLAGEYDRDFKKLLNIKYSKLDIELLGMLTLDQLKEIYLKRPIGIIPSIHEQCSYTAIEMSMFGLPVIYSYVDGLKEIFTDGWNGLKIDLQFDKLVGVSRDVNKFVDRIVRLILDEELRDSCGNEARKNYLENFTAEVMFNKLSEIYKLCLK